MELLDKLLNTFKDTIFLKDDSNLEKLVEELKKIKGENIDSTSIDKDIKFLEYGIKGENEIAYELIWNYGIDVNKIVLFQWYYNLGYNTKNLYSAFLSMMETANVKRILDVNNCIHDLGLWGISKKKHIQIDYIEKYDEILDEWECTFLNSDDHIACMCV